MADSPEEKKEKKGETFYDAKFSIEAMQNEPYGEGFTWRTALGAFFVCFVLLPGVIFMGLIVGQDIGDAADWVTIILFVELARRSFVSLKKQELYVLKYTVSQLTNIAGGVMLGGGVFAWLIFNGYLRNSRSFESFGIAQQAPDWFAPYGEELISRPFFDSVWFPAIAVLVLSMVLNKVMQFALGFISYKVTSDVEKLPFPLAPIHAEGAIALAESSQDKNKKGYRQYCFSVGVMIGAAFGLIYVAIPTISQAFLGTPITLLPIPFLDLTQDFEDILPGGTIGLSLNIGLLFTGFVLPWRISLGMFVTTILFQLIVNPLILQPNGFLNSWQPGKDAIETHVATTLDVYLSVGIGTSLAVFLMGVFGMASSLLKYRKNNKASKGEFDLTQLWHRDVERGDPPIWVPYVAFIIASLGFVYFSHYLINVYADPIKPFPIWILFLFAFVWTPINTYINARMSGIAGQYAGVPFVSESFIFATGYKNVDIWFAPLPLHNYGGMADRLRETQLTRTKFTSLIKAELLIFPLMLIASFIFWSYIKGLGEIPSDSYPYVQKFWPQFATMKAVFASGLQDGQSTLIDALKWPVIGISLAAALLMFGIFGTLGISTQYIYGGLGAMNGYPHIAVMIFAGALLGRFFFARKFGKERWTNYAPILAVGFGAGMGLIGMLAIAINFLWRSVGTGY